MSSSTIRVKPRRGVILAGIPAAGADVERELAEEWIRNGLVTKVDPAKPAAKKTTTPASPAKEG